MPRCTNCRQWVRASARLCPHCGARLAPPPAGKLLTGREWVDTVLGFIAGTVSPVLLAIGLLASNPTYRKEETLRNAVWLFSFVIGLLVVSVLHVVFLNRYPAFARGLKIVLMMVLAAALGAVAICLAVLTQIGRR
jgi:ABC-type xylose transport system permease subunit